MKSMIKDVKINSAYNSNNPYSTNKILLQLEYKSTESDLDFELKFWKNIAYRGESLLLATNEVHAGGMTLKELVKALEVRENKLNSYSPEERIGKAFVWVSVAAWLQTHGWEMQWLYEDEDQKNGWLWHESRKTLDYMPEVIEWMMTNNKFVFNKTEPVQNERGHIRNSYISDACRFVMDENTNAETLFTFSTDKEDIVRFYVAAHSNTSLETLQKLSSDKTEFVRNEAQDRLRDRMNKKVERILQTVPKKSNIEIECGKYKSSTNSDLVIIVTGITVLEADRQKRFVTYKYDCERSFNFTMDYEEFVSMIANEVTVPQFKKIE